MLHAPTVTDIATPLSSDRSRDYDLIRSAIAFLSETWAEQPSLEVCLEPVLPSGIGDNRGP